MSSAIMCKRQAIERLFLLSMREEDSYQSTIIFNHEITEGTRNQQQACFRIFLHEGPSNDFLIELEMTSFFVCQNHVGDCISLMRRTKTRV